MNIKAMFGINAVGTRLANLIASAACLLPLSAFGGNVASGVYLKPTNLPDVLAYSKPDPRFDPTSASDEELASAGFPPRPDPVKAPAAYRYWSRAVVGGQRIETPVLVMRNIKHSPAQIFDSGSTAATSSATSTNWSGFVVTGPPNTFGASSSHSSFTVTDFVVPAIWYTWGACGGPEYMSWWTGLDGWGNDDVLQAGIDLNASCSGGAVSTSYSAWYEWFDARSPSTTGEMALSNFPVSPGDEMYVEVWYTATAPQGHAYLFNVQWNEGVSVAFDPSVSEADYQGETAEWIAEATSVNGSHNLTNYIGMIAQFNYADPYNSSVNIYPGSAPSSMTNLSVTMINASGVPISACSLVSESSAGIQCATEGPARR